MWSLRRLFQKPKPLKARPIHFVYDFTKPEKNHWIAFEGGDNYAAKFRITGDVKAYDDVLVRLKSGRIGRYRLFSVLRDFSGASDWTALGMAIGYWSEPQQEASMAAKPDPKIKGLLGDGSGGLRSDPGESSALSSGFTLPSSEFWKVLERNEACHRRAGSMRSGSDL